MRNESLSATDVFPKENSIGIFNELIHINTAIGRGTLKILNKKSCYKTAFESGEFVLY